MHDANLDLLSGSGDSVEGSALGSCDGVGEGHIVVVRYQVLNRDLEVGKGRVELREPMDKAFRSGTLVVRRIVVFYTGGEDFVQLLEVTAVDDLAHFLLAPQCSLLCS